MNCQRRKYIEKNVLAWIVITTIAIGLFAVPASAASSGVKGTISAAFYNAIMKDAYYYFVPTNNLGVAIDVSGNSRKNGANIALHSLNYTNAQKYKLVPANNGYFYIMNANGKVLDVQNGSTACGSNVWQYQKNGSDAQLWKPYHGACGDPERSFSFKNKGSGLFLDCYSGSLKSGDNICVWQGNDSPAQSFYLFPCDGTVYKWITVNLDCSSLANWQISLGNAINSSHGIVRSKKVVSTQNTTVKMPVQGPSYSGSGTYVNKTITLPKQMKLLVHKHNYQTGFGRSWIYTNNGILVLNTCSCGYRQEVLFCEIPDAPCQITAVSYTHLRAHET